MPRVVAQATNIPQRVRSLWLRVAIAILSANTHFVRAGKLGRKINAPQRPRPTPLIGRRVLVVNLGLAPRLAAVEADVDPHDASAAARVGIARESHAFAGFDFNATLRIQNATGDGQVLD